MNYLTNYYKNLSEQLQAQLNHLEQIILESKKSKRKTERIKVTGAERPEGEYNPDLIGTLTGKGAKARTSVRVAPEDVKVSGETKQTIMHDAHELADEDNDAGNMYTSGKKVTAKKSNIQRY